MEKIVKKTQVLWKGQQTNKNKEIQRANKYFNDGKTKRRRDYFPGLLNKRKERAGASLRENLKRTLKREVENTEKLEHTWLGQKYKRNDKEDGCKRQRKIAWNI